MMRTIRKNMKIILIIVIAAFGVSIFYGLGQYRSSQKTTSYMAEINGVEISYNQWQATFQNAISRYDNKTISSMDQSTINSLKNNILKQMINSELLFQQAKKEKVKISKNDIDSEIDKIKENFSSPEEFDNALKANNITLNQLQDDIKKQLMINYVLGEAKNKINITEEELLEYFNKNKDSFFEPEKIHALHIIVNTEEEANNILNKLKEGIIDFSELAKQKSIDASAQNGGDLGFFTRGQMVKEFEDAAFSLKPGEISNVVKTEFGYHIIKLIEKKEAYNPTFEEAKENINNILKNQKEIEATQNLISNLTDNANIIIKYNFESENQSSSSSPEETQTSNSTSIEEISPEETTNNNQVKDNSEIK